MNSLEYNEKEIKENIKLLKKYKDHLLAFPQANVEKRMEEIKEDLTYLQQIKSELNVLKIITKCIRITPVSYDEDGLSKTAYDYCLETDGLTDEEYQILDEYMKTLEVQDE